MDVTLTDPQSPVAESPHKIAHHRPQWMHYGDIIRILGTIVVVIGHVSDMMLYQSRQPGSLNGPGTFNWHVLNVWDAFSRWAVPIYIMLSGSLLLDPNRTESARTFYHKRLMRIGAPLVFFSLFFMYVDVYYTGWRATHNLPQQHYESYLHFDSLTTKDGRTFIGNIDKTDSGYQVETASEKLELDSEDVAKVEPHPTTSADWQFAWSANSPWQWIHNLFVYHPDQWGGHTRWEWFKYLVFFRPQLAWLNLLKGEPYMHMHFIFRIAGLYAFTPVLRVALKHIPRPMLLSTVLLMLVWSSADSVANNITETELSAFARFVPFLGYYLMGYLLRDFVISRKVLLLMMLAWLACIGILAGGEELLVKHYVIDAGLDHISGPPSMSMLLYDFLSPIRVVTAIVSWIVLVNLFRDPWPYSHTGRSIIRFWANTTLGLYLIHPFFREMWFMRAPGWIIPYLQKIISMHGFFGFHQLQMILQEWELHGINAAWPNVWEGVPMTATLVYVPSLISTILIMRIPIVRRIAG